MTNKTKDGEDNTSSSIKTPLWNSEHDIEQDIESAPGSASVLLDGETENSKSTGQDQSINSRGLLTRFRKSQKERKQTKSSAKKHTSSFSLLGSQEKSKDQSKEVVVKSRSRFERLAYDRLSKRLPKFPGYMESYEQAGIPLLYESYLSTAILLSAVITLPAFLVSLLLEMRLLHLSFGLSFFGSLILGGIVFAISLFSWLAYPLQRRNNFKSKLDNQLAYSFGILGVLAASGMNIERLFERLAFSESNPVLAELAKRFLRNVRLFGMDTESALREVAEHSPSSAFSKMLESIAIAFRTTGSIHSLVMFESSRLFEEKKNKLSKIISNLGVVAELYITLVVVGPIIFIVMMAIFGLLPSGGLPDPVLVINALVFVGVPIISVMFILMLDSIVARA